MQPVPPPPHTHQKRASSSSDWSRASHGYISQQVNIDSVLKSTEMPPSPTKTRHTDTHSTQTQTCMEEDVCSWSHTCLCKVHMYTCCVHTYVYMYVSLCVYTHRCWNRCPGSHLWIPGCVYATTTLPPCSLLLMECCNIFLLNVAFVVPFSSSPH